MYLPANRATLRQLLQIYPSDMGSSYVRRSLASVKKHHGAATGGRSVFKGVDGCEALISNGTIVSKKELKCYSKEHRLTANDVGTSLSLRCYHLMKGTGVELELVTPSHTRVDPQLVYEGASFDRHETFDIPASTTAAAPSSGDGAVSPPLTLRPYQVKMIRRMKEWFRGGVETTARARGRLAILNGPPGIGKTIITVQALLPTSEEQTAAPSARLEYRMIVVACPTLTICDQFFDECVRSGLEAVVETSTETLEVCKRLDTRLASREPTSSAVVVIACHQALAQMHTQQLDGCLFAIDEAHACLERIRTMLNAGADVMAISATPRRVRELLLPHRGDMPFNKLSVPIDMLVKGEYLMPVNYVIPHNLNIELGAQHDAQHIVDFTLVMRESRVLVVAPADTCKEQELLRTAIFDYVARVAPEQFATRWERTHSAPTGSTKCPTEMVEAVRARMSFHEIPDTIEFDIDQVRTCAEGLRHGMYAEIRGAYYVASGVVVHVANSNVNRSEWSASMEGFRRHGEVGIAILLTIKQCLEGYNDPRLRLCIKTSKDSDVSESAEHALFQAATRVDRVHPSKTHARFLDLRPNMNTIARMVHAYDPERGLFMFDCEHTKMEDYLARGADPLATETISNINVRRILNTRIRGCAFRAQQSGLKLENREGYERVEAFNEYYIAAPHNAEGNRTSCLEMIRKLVVGLGFRPSPPANSLPTRVPFMYGEKLRDEDVLDEAKFERLLSRIKEYAPASKATPDNIRDRRGGHNIKGLRLYREFLVSRLPGVREPTLHNDGGGVGVVRPVDSLMIDPPESEVLSSSRVQGPSAGATSAEDDGAA